jgi:signal transduction histidine kinase
MRVNIARRLAAREAPGLIEELEKIEAIARQATGDLRLLLFQIHPQLLESKGLAAALQDLGQKTSQVHDKRVSIQVESQVLTRLDMDQQVSIFDLVERALREACKKEELENVRVRLESGSQGQAILK